MCAGVDAEPVRDVHQRVRVRGERAAFLEPQRRAHVAPLAERRAGGAERAGHDEHVAGPRPRAAGNARAAAERGHRDDERRALRRVAADDGDTGLGQALGRARPRPPSGSTPGATSVTSSASGSRARGGEVAQVDGRSTPAEVAPGEPVEPEVDALDERVLGDDELARELRRRRAGRRRSGRAARAPPGARAHRSPRASSTACLSAGSADGPDRGHAGGAGADAVAGVRAHRRRRSRRPGRRPPRRSSAGPSGRCAGSASSFDGVSQIGPDAEVVRVGGERLLERRRGAAEQQPGPACALGAGVASGRDARRRHAARARPRRRR